MASEASADLNVCTCARWFHCFDLVPVNFVGRARGNVTYDFFVKCSEHRSRAADWHRECGPTASRKIKENQSASNIGPITGQL